MARHLLNLSTLSVQYEVSGESLGYLCVGLSKDKVQGDDETYICAKNAQGGINVFKASFTGSALQLLPANDIQSAGGTFSGGMITCSFVVTKVSSTDQFFIFLGKGTLGTNGSFNAPQIQLFSDTKVGLTDLFISSASLNVPSILTAAGALLIYAWLGLEL
ncbi:putative ferric-chelate reductase 1 [Amia ocellicauda]|uniref:putative ferric-chelate reductase 1 n=1 Tax=Amia ocellicauda TaxID=2972642 RepID=UPI0034639B9C